MHPVQFRQINTNGHQYSYETQNSSMHACKYTSNVLMLLIYTLKHRWIWYGRHCPQPCLNIRLQQDDLHKPMPPLPCQHTCPAQTQWTNAANPQEFLKIRMPSHAFLLAMCLSVTGPAKRHLWSPGAVTSTRKRSCKEGWFQVPCCGDTNASTQMLKAVLPHLQIRNQHITHLANQGKRFFAIGINLTKGFTAFKGWVFSNYTNRGTFSLVDV